MKQRILGGPIGRIAIQFRDKLAILRAAYSTPERVGTIANDQLATTLVTQLCKSDKTFIDVGAHIGSIVAEVIYRNPSIKIVAIEAIPEKVKRLRQKFPGVQFHECAVGNASGDVSFFVNTRQSGYSSLRRPDRSTEGTLSEIIVPIRRLDDLVDPTNIDTIKIDVEGEELGVLSGSTALLEKGRPTIMFESGLQSDSDSDGSKNAIYELLTSVEYAVLTPNRVAHNDPGLSKDAFIQGHLYPRLTTNYFAIPLENRVEIRDRARQILGIRSS